MSLAASLRYLDSSVILAALLDEASAPAVLAGGFDAFCSELALVEVARTLERARLSGRLTDAQFALKTKESHDLLSALGQVPLSSEIVQNARAAFPIAVRALDALHVATAQWLRLELGREVRFWSRDQRQLAAAQSRGLEIVA